LRLQRILPGLLAVAFVCATAQTHPEAQSATRTILQIEDQWLHAKTASEAARFLAPDFVGVGTRGVIETRRQRLARRRGAL
jgi:hypothetical protein